MCNNTKAISFWNFLNENTIEIPIIQRDYAQGRLRKENLRKTFLADLKKALDNEHPYKDIPMKLDFVYGSAENGKLNPLDGQQRLTTLWLLHWYIALRAGELNEDNCKIFRRFTYETRISSREFCENLCKPEYFQNFDGKDIVGFITKQTWSYSAWKQDPTIQSMLRMLGGTKIADKKGEDIIDGIEELFQETNEDDFKSYWEKLTQKEVIVFYHLPLKDFGLSDDLYIKMNARGKQLTSFENFKADLIGYITNQAEDESLEEPVRAEWKKLLDPESGIPIMLDTEWTDIFWKNRSNDNRIDEIYFAFINRYFLQELICAKKNQTDLYSADNLEKENGVFRHLYGEKGDDSQLQYSGLDKYLFNDGKAIPFYFFTSLRKTLNNLKPNLSGCKFFGECCINIYFPTWVDSKFEFIPKYDETSNITTLGQKERVVFLAVCRYFEKGAFDSISFKRWMRVVWNIVENSGIETIPAMIGAMRLIDELSEGAHDIYKFISKKKVKSNFAEDQVTEEIAKAKQILDENGTLRRYNGSCQKADGSNYQTWEEIIIEAEKYAFFKGAIRFLFTDEKGDVNDQSWQAFDTKWPNARKYFSKEGEVNPDYQIDRVLFKKLLKSISDFNSLYEFYYDDSLDNWRSYILLNDKLAKCVDKLLTEAPVEKRDNWDNSQRRVFEDLTQKDILLHIEKGFELDIRNGFYLLTMKGRGNGQDWKRYFIGVERNSILSKLYGGDIREEAGGNKIYSSQKINYCGFFWGEHINFKYNNHFFQWYGAPNEKELDVYLMENEWADYKKQQDPQIEGQPDIINYYCFKVTKEMETDTSLFTKQLDCLIAQAYPEKSNKVCYYDCQNKVCE